MRAILLGLCALSSSAVCAHLGTQTPASPNLITSSAGKFYSQNGAIIYRVPDRLFTGFAAFNDGAYPNVAKDWLSTLETSWGHRDGYSVFAMLATLTNDDPAAGYAILGGAQTLHLNASGAAIGVQGHGIANQPSPRSNAWGLYGEAHRTLSGAGSAYGIEADPVAHVPSISPTPDQQGNTIGAQLACGGEYSAFTQFDCSSAVQIAANGAPFKTGINVMRGSIRSGNPSIQLPTGNGLVFYDHSGHLGGSIEASFTGNTANLNFNDRGLEITASDGAPIASFLITGVVNVGSVLKLQKTLVAALPTCSPVSEGELSAVTDASSAAFDAPLSGGGTNHVMAYCNGTHWTVH